MNENAKQERSDLPTPGYRLLDVSAALQRYSIVDPDDPEAEVEDKPSMRFMWDWRMLEDRQFEVFLGVWLMGTTEQPQEVEVRLVGTFAIDGEVQALALREFVHTSAPAILMPYVRDKVTGLTADGPFGSYYMPIVNVQSLMKGYAYENSSGAKQLQEMSEESGTQEGTPPAE